MYCNKCGKQVDDRLYYCDGCGEALNKPYSQQPFGNNNQNTNQAPRQSYPQVEYNNGAKFEYQLKSKFEEAHTLGVLSIVLGFLFTPIVGIILACIGICKINEIPPLNDFSMEAKRKSTKNLCWIGIILPTAVYLISVVLIFIFIVFMGAAFM